MGVCREAQVSIYSSSTRQFSVSELVRLAFIDARLIGLWTTPDNSQAKYGRDKLDIILDRIPLRAPTVRQSRVDAVTLSNGVSEYDLGVDVLGVPGPAWYVELGESLTAPERRHPVDVVGEVRWYELSQGNVVTADYPTAVWAQTSETPPLLHVWPPPTGGTIQIRVTKLLADAGPGANELDIERVWVPYLQKALTAELLQQRSVVEAKALRTEAEALLVEVNDADGEQTQSTLTFRRENRWRKL